MKNIQHFLWDFDGTLFDTYPVLIGNLQQALEEFGFDCDPVEAMRYMLVNLTTARNHFADKYGIDRDALLEVFNRYYAQTVVQENAAPMAGVQQVLEKICSTGRYNYIFTNRKVEETVRYLKQYGLEGYFREIVGAESPCFAYKPAPDAILYLMDRYQMDPEQAVMVGDRECDLSSGKNAGIGSVHFVCRMVPEDLECDWRVDSFAQMLTML